MQAIIKSFKTILTHPNNKGYWLNSIIIIAYWKINQVFLHLPALVEIAPGVRIVCYPQNSYGSFIVYAIWPEYDELNFIYTSLGEKDTYIDVGAHIGDSSLLAASKIKTGKVIACEPTPEIFQELVANIKLNNFEQLIHPVRKAISNKTGTAFFALESSSEVNHLSTQQKGKKGIKVETTTIDSIAKEYSLKDISLLKIDVEGLEFEVIQGAQKSLQLKKVQKVLFEVNPTVNSISNKVALIEDFLRNFDFSFYEFDDQHFLKEVSHLFVPTNTSNFLAVSAEERKRSTFKRWLK